MHILTAYFDAHEGAGTWWSAIATLAAVLTSLAIAWSSYCRQAAEKRDRERQRLSIRTARDEAHGCLKVDLTYHPVDGYVGYEAQIKVLGPSQARLLEGVRRPDRGPASQYTRIGIGRPIALTQHTAPLTNLETDRDDALRGIVYVISAVTDDWTIDLAQLSVCIYARGAKRPTIRLKIWVSPAGEDPKLVALERSAI